jgi:hypothetical protein
MALLNCAFRLLFRRIFHIVTAMTGFHTPWPHCGHCRMPNAEVLGRVIYENVPASSHELVDRRHAQNPGQLG